MIRVLGIKRIFILIFFLAMNVAIGCTVYLFLMPLHMQKEADLQGLRGQIGTVQADIARMQVEFDQLAVQQDKFNKLKAHGFFYNQSRREAELVFESIQKQAGVIAAVANIQSGIVEENAEAQKADYKVLSSPIKVHIDAVNSADVFRYVYLLDSFFPGHVAIEDIKLERKGEITNAVLRSIANGGNPVLVQADIDMIWRTMIPKSEIIDTTLPKP